MKRGIDESVRLPMSLGDTCANVSLRETLIM